MAKRKDTLKSYAMGIWDEVRRDAHDFAGSKLPAIDFGEVLTTSPNVTIEPHHAIVDEYDDEELIFLIDPDELEVDDLVLLGRDPSNQPVVIGIANSLNPDPFQDPDADDLRDNFNALYSEARSWRSPVVYVDSLPTSGNRHGDVRLVMDTCELYKWDGELDEWQIIAGGGGGNFLPISGGTMEGDIIMEPGTMITINDGPQEPTDAVNKAYVDALFALCCDTGGDLINTVTIDATDAVPCYACTNTDQVILVNVALGPVEVCLPSNHVEGKIYEIKHVNGDLPTNNITIYSNDGDTIDGDLTVTMASNLLAVTVYSDGTNWWVL